MVFPSMNTTLRGKLTIIFEPVPFAFYFYQACFQTSIFIYINLCFSVFIKTFFLYKSAIFVKNIQFIVYLFLSRTGTGSFSVKIISVFLIFNPSGFSNTFFIKVIIIFFNFFYFIFYLDIIYFILISRSLSHPSGLTCCLYRHC